MTDPSWVRFVGPWRHFDVRANGIRFHAVESVDAPQSGPLVLLLHGFGEFWWSWRHQLSSLSAAGYRAVAVDLRGYGDTDKPPRGYDGWTLAGDTNGLIRALGYTRADLVGHADGGLVCWATATLHPRAVRSISVIASPHPRALRRSVARDRSQRANFLGGFLGNQFPRRAESIVTRNNGQFIVDMFTDRSTAQWRTTDDFTDTIGNNQTAIQIAGVAHCSLEYRRWAFRSQLRRDGHTFMTQMNSRLSVPVLAVHGNSDTYIHANTVAASRFYASTFTYVELPNSAHFAHQENPTRFHDALVAHLAP